MHKSWRRERAMGNRGATVDHEKGNQCGKEEASQGPSGPAQQSGARRRACPWLAGRHAKEDEDASR
jgi:hypothetical protein